MNTGRRYLLLPLVMALLLPAAHAGGSTNSPEGWLDRMNTALRQLNYQGTFVYIHDNRIETMQVTHRGDARGGISRVVSLTGPKREIIGDHQEMKCIVPANRSVLVERHYTPVHFPDVLPASIETAKLATYYRFSDLGEDRIAGQRCHVIGIEPRDHYRYGYKLWLDARTAMLLRSDLVTPEGQVLEQVMFTNLSYPQKISDAELRPREIGPGYVWNIQGDPVKPTLGEHTVLWKAAQLPPGFSLSLSELQRVAGVSGPVRHLVYSDGLASVSVFAELAAAGRKQLLGPSQMGTISAFGREVGGRHITVVGEVPPATVSLIAQAMQPQVP